MITSPQHRHQRFLTSLLIKLYTTYGIQTKQNEQCKPFAKNQFKQNVNRNGILIVISNHHQTNLSLNGLNYMIYYIVAVYDQHIYLV